MFCLVGSKVEPVDSKIELVDSKIELVDSKIELVDSKVEVAESKVQVAGAKDQMICSRLLLIDLGASVGRLWLRNQPVREEVPAFRRYDWHARARWRENWR